MDYMSTATPGVGMGIVQGYQVSANLAGDDIEKVKTKF
jgi:hypothetical protein